MEELYYLFHLKSQEDRVDVRGDTYGVDGSIVCLFDGGQLLFELHLFLSLS